jgi:hypothetical protein
MKTAQWTAVLALALMVGGITFVMVYLGGSKSNTADTPIEEQPLSLTFASKRYPDEGGKALTSEVNQEGHQDYWFVNDSDKNVNVGLSGKSCTCANVEIAVVNDYWKPQLVGQACRSLLQRGVQRLENLPTWAATYESDRVFVEVPEAEVKTTQLSVNDLATVPAGALGWVRIRWHRKYPEALALWAELWMGHPSSGVIARLDAGVRVSEPLEAQKEVSLGSFDVRELEKGKNVSIVCWSVTRPSVRIKATLTHLRGGTAESDPVEMGEPERLGSAGIHKLEQSQSLHMVRLRSAYKIPLKLKSRAKDGTPFDWGHFRRFVTLSSDDESIEPVQVDVTGEVLGDVTVGSGKESGTINLGPFLSSRGAHGDIMLHTDVRGLTLELDKERVPPYLEATFPDKPEETAGGHRIWVLRVKVKPGEARGEFPRSDESIYRDSAIYVKTTHEKPSRLIRIPVRGVANDG